MVRKLFNIILTLVLLTVFSLPMVFPDDVYALTPTRAVAGEGAETSGTYEAPVGTPAGTFANLNSDNGDASVIHMNSSFAYLPVYHCYTFQAFATANGGINSVALTWKARTYPGLYVGNTPYARYSGTNYYGTPITITGATYVSNTETNFGAGAGKNPATGTVWRNDDTLGAQYNVNNWQFGIKQSSGSGDDVFWTYGYITIDYVPVSLPTVTTVAASGIIYDGAHKATLNGSIDVTGGENEDFRGFEWGTTSNTTMPASTQSPLTATYTANWTEAGSFGIASFSHQITGLALCTTYYFRAYAHNSAGWAYGVELSFTSLCDPDIITQAATNVAATTARLNALVINNGGQLADVRFYYSTVSGNCTDGADCTLGTCNGTSYNGTTPWVENIYTTGSTPYVDISGLVGPKTYYFCVQIRNDVSCRCGGQLSFTTSSGISAPTVLKGIPAATTMSLFWIKGVGSTRTLVRYKSNTYPSGTGDASSTVAYFDTQTSVVVSGLTMGTTYYIRAWGESGGTYSTANTTLIITTLSGDSTPGVPLPPNTTSTSWFQSPDYTNMSGMPWYGMVNWWADSFGMPRSTLWFFCAIFLALACGVVVYWKGGQKIMLTGFVVILLIGFGVTLKLISMWLLIPFLIVFFTSVALGERI